MLYKVFIFSHLIYKTYNYFVIIFFFFNLVSIKITLNLLLNKSKYFFFYFLNEISKLSIQYYIFTFVFVREDKSFVPKRLG